MARVGSVCLVSFLLALLAVLGLDVYTARHPRLDESGLLSSLDRLTRIVPSGARVKKLKVHHVHVCAAGSPVRAQAPPATFAASWASSAASTSDTSA
jgi:hypothetical protein